MPCPGSVLLLMTITHGTGWPNLGLSLWLLLGQLCHLTPYLPQLAPAMHVMEVVLLYYLWWILPVFPGNTESQGSWVSSPETGMVIKMGHSQMPLDLQGHSSCLMGLGCGPLSGYWFQVSVHLGHPIWWSLTWKHWPWIETPDEFRQLGAKAHARKWYKWACGNHVFSTVSQKSIYPLPMDSFTDVGTLPTWEKGTHQPSQSTRMAI